MASGPEHRAFARLNYRGGKLRKRAFPNYFAIATKMCRDSPDMFAQAWGTEAEFRARNAENIREPVPVPTFAAFHGRGRRLSELDEMD